MTNWSWTTRPIESWAARSRERLALLGLPRLSPGLLAHFQLVAPRFHQDGVARREGAAQHLEGEGIEQVLLDRSFERPRSVDRIVSPFGEDLSRTLGKLERQPLFVQEFLQARQL